MAEVTGADHCGKHLNVELRREGGVAFEYEEMKNDLYSDSIERTVRWTCRGTLRNSNLGVETRDRGPSNYNLNMPAYRFICGIPLSRISDLVNGNHSINDSITRVRYHYSLQCALVIESRLGRYLPTSPTICQWLLQSFQLVVEDPKWQIKFTMIWCSNLALTVVVSIPSLILGLRHGRSLKGITGISETNGYQPARSDGKEPPPICRRHRRLVGAWNALISPTYWSPPKLGLNLGQIIVLLAYLAAVPVCIIRDAPFISNPNRAGFI
ncbi:uncharacterized protein F5147DRAFT_816195 [Suillus discolor]|uniref:Uncharacterized protein n=1 Tax=Suillus discolor TaxID=1912936 RepID=A0A9P7JQF3_9AGAM|nr:uncharacterized protein F5147DRAFT_816195 [Suillus discolor]KAG2097930.1 hypothetical protein F5147DRAFT_816195 [Suillus discolor]